VRTVVRETELAAGIERVWEAMLLPSTFVYVCRGLLGIPSLHDRRTPMYLGEEGSGWLFLFHVIPLARHTIHVIGIDEASHTIRTNEHGGLIKQWDHTLHAEAIGATRTRYRDTIDIDAGRLTPLFVASAKLIFRYRHHRWHKLLLLTGVDRYE